MSNSYNGATITVNRAEGVNSDDNFSFNSSALTALGLTLNNSGAGSNPNTLTSGTTVIATLNPITGNIASGQLQITFASTASSNISSSQVNQLLQSIQYSSASNTPASLVDIGYSVSYNGNINPVNSGNTYEMAINNAGTMQITGGTIGARIPMGIVSNSGTFNLSNGSVKVNEFLNTSLLSGPTLNVTGGNMYVASLISNMGGGISVTGGDLSSLSDGSSNIINVANQTISITGSGTLGKNHRMGNVLNEGTLNVASDMAIGSFTNGLGEAQLNISGGKTTLFGDINNIVGTINISGGDVSSNIKKTALTQINNGVNGTITASGGSLGAATALGTVTNSGTINFGSVSGSTTSSGGSASNANNFIANVGTIVNNANATITINNYNVAATNASSALSDTITNTGTLNINNGDLSISGSVTGAQLTNTGTLTIASSGSVGAIIAHPLSIIQSGNMTTAGTLNSNVTFGMANAQLNITGGAINGIITGYSGSNTNAININVPGGTFSATNSITNVATIDVTNGNFTFNPNSINSVVGGAISLGNNAGISLSIKNGTVSSNITGGSGGDMFSISGGNVSGTITGGAGGDTFNVSGGTVSGAITVGAGSNTFNVSGGTISGAINASSGNTTFNVSGGSTISNSITAGSSNANVLNIGVASGTAASFVSPQISNIQTININNTTGPNNFTVSSAISGVNANFSTMSGTTTVITGGGSISGSGSIGTISTPSAGVITVSGTGTFNMSGSTYNSGTIQLGGGNVVLGAFNNVQNTALLAAPQAGATTTGSLLDVTQGQVQTGNINNASGTIKIEGGDVSSVSHANPSSLTNAVNQTITLTGAGTIGQYIDTSPSQFPYPLGDVSNSGTINLGGGNVTVGTITNAAGGNLTITSGSIKTTSVINSGTISANSNNTPINIINALINSSGGILNLNGSNITVANTSAAAHAIDNAGTINFYQGTLATGTNTDYLNNSGILNIGAATTSVVNISAATAASVVPPTINLPNIQNATGGTINLNINNLNAPIRLNNGTNNGTINFANIAPATIAVANGAAMVVNANAGANAGTAYLNNISNNAGTINVSNSMLILSNGTSSGSTVSNPGTITVANGTLGAPTSGVTLQNTGTLNVQTGGIIGPNLSLMQSGAGNINTSGTINSAVTIADSATGTLTITGGNIYGPISGNSSNNSSIVYINIPSGGTFSTTNKISNVNTIELHAGNLVVNNPIYGVGGVFQVDSGTVATIASRGDVSGLVNFRGTGGAIGAIASNLIATYAVPVTVNQVNLAPTVQVPADQVIASGNSLVFSGSYGTQINVNDVDNNGGVEELTLTPVGGTLQLGNANGLTVSTDPITNIITAVGTVSNLNKSLQGLIFTPTASSNLGLTISLNDQGNTGSGGSKITTKNIGISIGATGVSLGSQVINDPSSYYSPLYQEAFDSLGNNTGTPVLLAPSITVANLQLPTLNPSLTTNYKGINITLARDGGVNPDDLFSLGTIANATTSYNSITQTLTITRTSDSTVIATVNGNASSTNGVTGQLQIQFNNASNVTVTSSDVENVLRAVYYKNNSQDPPTNLNIIYAVNQNGVVATNQAIVNYGTITLAKPSVTTGTGNTSEQSSNLPAGSIGSTSPMGTVTNMGTINAGGGAFNVGEFINNSTATSPTFNISSGNVTTTGISNISGGIAISGGDLSSSPNVVSNVVNVVDQTINVSNSGTIGQIKALGNVTNEGTFIAGGGNVTVGQFINSLPSSVLNVNSNTMTTNGDIDNYGAITVNGGVLTSSAPNAKLVNQGSLRVIVKFCVQHN